MAPTLVGYGQTLHLFTPEIDLNKHPPLPLLEDSSQAALQLSDPLLSPYFAPRYVPLPPHPLGSGSLFYQQT